MNDCKKPSHKYGRETKKRGKELQRREKWQRRNLIILEIVMLVAFLTIGIIAYYVTKNQEQAEEERLRKAQVLLEYTKMIDNKSLTEAEHQVVEVEEPMPYEIKEKYSKEMFNDKYSLLALYYLGANIYVEAKYQSDYKQRAVGSVAMNREKSPSFQNDLIDVFKQYGQYAGMIEGTATRIIEILENNEPISEELFMEIERCIENAEWLLENGSILDEEYVYQATFKQGYDCIFIEGDWFGKEKRDDI